MAVAVIAAAGFAAFAYLQARSIVAELRAGPKAAVVDAVSKELHRPPLQALVSPPPERSAETILLIGSDRRWTGGDGARSDTMMLVRIEPSRHRIALLSIPRDLYVSIPRHGHDRINMAFHYGGERLLTRVVRDTFGVRIDHFVSVDFHGFKDLIADVGGIWVPVDQRYFNRNVGTPQTNYADIDLEPGYQKLDAAQALAFARYRHDDNDFVRASRQQLVLRVAAHDALEDVRNPFRLRRIARAIAKATTSDISSLREIYLLAQTIHSTPASRLVRMTVQASSVVLDGADYVTASPKQLRATVRAWLGVPLRTNRVAAQPAPRRLAIPSARLVPDGGVAGSILASVRNGIRRCTPNALPPGYHWPTGAARSYTLAGHPATALYATAGSGNSLLWMYTTWPAPPALAKASATLHRGGRQYQLYTEHRKLRQIAWRVGATQVWLTNTLQDSVSNAQMIALAVSCR
jgi:polyisoprenyl-teichoic acid--peptidoglycan teichoic acid transferase